MLACSFLIWTKRGWLERATGVSALEGRAEAVDLHDRASPTGYARGQRELIIPERHEASYHWIAQTQQMFARGEWRVRSVEYDNAPIGRGVRESSLCRWWLGLLAWGRHAVTDQPIGLSVEWAALYSGPCLHTGLLIVGALGVAWRFGAFAAAAYAVGVVGMFPFAAGFLPGVVDHQAFARVATLGSLLLLLAGLRAEKRSGIWFGFAGSLAAFGFWVAVPTALPIAAGVFVGALLVTLVTRSKSPGCGFAAAVGNSWRIWGLSGAATILFAYLVEYFPAHLGEWNLGEIHPIYGLAWLGAGELLARAAGWRQGGKGAGTVRDLGAVAVAILAIAALPIALRWSGSAPLFATDLVSARLTSQPGGAVYPSFYDWLRRDGASARLVAVLVPFLLCGVTGWATLRRNGDNDFKISTAVLLGPLLVALLLAVQQLNAWSQVDTILLVVLVAGTAVRPPGTFPSDWPIWLGAVALFAAFGIVQVLPSKKPADGGPLASLEAEELIERHLAHWLAKHAGEEGAIVFAPPAETTTLCFYGGLRGIGSFSPDNRAGLGTTLAIAGVKTMEEAQALLQGRAVKYIVLPSWDPFFDEFARLYLAKNFSNRANFFARELTRWNLPLWLKPIPYQMPVIGGFEGQSVLVFEMVEEQSPALAASRLAEYFVETGDLDRAIAASDGLRRFPGEIVALAARAQVLNARRDIAGAAQLAEAVISRLSGGGDRYLPWDRRVSVAIVLAQAGRIAEGQAQARRCLTDISEKRLRSLTTGSLYNFLILIQAFGFHIADPKHQELALDLLPTDLRHRL